MTDMEPKPLCPLFAITRAIFPDGGFRGGWFDD